MSLNVVTLLYLIASVCFIQPLKGLSNPKTARIGNTFGMAGMAIAILTTLALIVKQAAFLEANLRVVEIPLENGGVALQI
jgi:NAD(P) transhydrogenase subunit beta